MEAKKRFIVDGFRMSREDMAEGWTMPYAHYHEAYEIYILESGERTVVIDDTEYSAKASDATMFGALTSHKSRGNVPFSGICIHFTEHYLDLHFTAQSKRTLMRCFSEKLIHIDEEGFRYIKKASEDFIPEASDNFLVLANILDILCKSVSVIPETAEDGKETRMKKSQLILRYVNENYIDIDKVSDITEHFNVSENYVFKVFRTAYGMTPKQYINSLRIKHACHRLRFSNSTIREIAEECGFLSYERFSAVFKKLMNMTATEYRAAEKSSKR